MQVCSVQRMREVAGEFVAAELDSRHSVDRERMYTQDVCVCAQRKRVRRRKREG